MVVHQCVTCLRQHPLQAPAFCGCGSTSFTALLGDDDDAPTTSPEGGAVAKIRHTPGIAAETLAELQGALSHAFGGPVEVVESSFGPAAASSTSGQASPPSVSESSALSASAPKPGADFESADDSEHDVGGIECGQDGSRPRSGSTPT